MAVKCIAVGNRIMGDDSIGIRVAERISTELEREDIEVIIGETDIDYALSRIDDGDYLFILDAAYSAIEPGTIIFTPIKNAVRKQWIYSVHHIGLIDLLKFYNKMSDGFIIGIEVEKIDFCIELSDTLKRRLPGICMEVCEFMHQVGQGNFNFKSKES